MKQWYAIYCRPRQEERAETHLARQGFEVFRPRLRLLRQRRAGMRPVVESLFPRYLFIHLDDGNENWAPIRSTRGVISLVKAGQAPLPVPDKVIEDLRGRLHPESDCIDMLVESDLKPGERLTITEGPFAGYEAVFQARSGEERVVVLLEIMHRAHRLQLPDGAVRRR